MINKFYVEDIVDVHDGTFMSDGKVVEIEMENQFSEYPIYLVRGYDKQFWYRESQLSHAVNPQTD